MSDLTIYSTNTLNPREYVMPFRSTNRETSLVLPGPDSYNYGQALLTNLVHLLENFCDTSAPLNPTLGQTYYNSSTEKLNVYTSAGWHEINLIPNTEPVNAIFLDKASATQYNGQFIDDLLHYHIPLSGNTAPVVVTTNYTSQDPRQAVTKDYVDNTLVADKFSYIPIDGGSINMTGPLKLKPTLSTDADNTAVTVEYVNNLGTLTTIVDTSDSNFILSTYQVAGRKNDKGQIEAAEWLTIVNFSTIMLSTVATVKVNLADINTVFSSIDGANMIVNCNTIGVSCKLHVEVLDGATFRITRDTTTGDVQIQGTVIGFKKPYTN
jgi:hypothetical protein